MNSDIWQIDDHLCRCCHAEGSFHNLAEPRPYCGDNEIYADMLRDYLNIEIRPIPGLLSELTYNICTTCISKLRESIQFKKQVQSCEKRFIDLYLKNKIRALRNNCNTHSVETNNITIVKEEPDYSTIELKEEYLNLDIDSNNEADNTEPDFDLDDDDFKSEDEELLSEMKKGKGKGKGKPEKMIKIVLKKERQRQKRESEKKKEIQLKKKSDTAEDVQFTFTKSEDGTKNFTCKMCQHVFKNRNCFSQHYNHVHLKKRPRLRSCHLCDVKVPGYMRAFHMEEVHGLPAPTCNACGKKFAYPFQVLRHQKFYHMGERKFACKSCDWKFSTRSGLRNHEMKHKQERSFKCHVCDKQFTWKSNLVIHLKIHLNDKRHVCTVCCEAFVQQSSLKYHIMKKHPDMV